LRLIAAAFRTLSQINESSQQILREKIISSIIVWFEESSSSSSLSSSSSSLSIDIYLALNTVLNHVTDDFSVWSAKGYHPQGSSFGLVEAISFMKQRINSATTFYDPLILTYKESLVAVYMKGKETNHVNACCQPNTSIAKKTNFKTGLNILMRSIILLKMSLIAAWNIRNPFFKPYGALVRLCSKVFN